MKTIKTTISILLASLLLFGLSLSAFAAGGGALTDAGGDIVGIAHRGLWGEFPENTREAFRAAKEAGLDYVLADVSVTKDGVPVVMEALSAARMLSGAKTEAVADYSLEELRALPLRKGAGGAGNGDSPCTVPTLNEAIADAAENGYTLVFKFDAAALDTVLSALRAGDPAVLYPTGKTKDVLAAVADINGAFAVIAEKRSNVIFSVLSFIRRLENAGAAGAVLKTTNRYGVIYYKSTLAKCKGLRAMADTSSPATAGARQDTEKWWDDLVSRGYSAVITDDPVGFAAYLQANAAARARLNEAYEAAKSKRLPKFASPLSDNKKTDPDALSAAEALLADASASTTEMRDAFAALTSAMRAIDINYEAIDTGVAERTVTLPRILLCVGAAAAVIAVQIYFYKRRKAA